MPSSVTFSEPGARSYLSYGRELLDQGLEGEAIVAFERAAQGNPSASTLYQLGTLLVRSQQPAKARAAFERALEIQPRRSTISSCITAICPAGPPKLMNSSLIQNRAASPKGTSCPVVRAAPLIAVNPSGDAVASRTCTG